MSTRRQTDNPTSESRSNHHSIVRSIVRSVGKRLGYAFGSPDWGLAAPPAETDPSQRPPLQPKSSAGLTPPAATAYALRQILKPRPSQTPTREAETDLDVLAGIPLESDESDRIRELKTAVEMIRRNAGGARRIVVVGVPWTLPVAATIQRYARARKVAVWCVGESERGLASIAVARAANSAARPAAARHSP